MDLWIVFITIPNRMQIVPNTFTEARSEARVGGDRMDRGRPEDQVAWQAVSTEKVADLQCFPFPISNCLFFGVLARSF